MKRAAPPVCFIRSCIYLGALTIIAVLIVWTLQSEPIGERIAQTNDENAASPASKLGTTITARPIATPKPTTLRDKLDSATFDELLEMLRRAGSSDVSADRERLLHQIARSRPALAIELARAIGRTDAEVSQWTFALVDKWAEHHPATAWSWLGRQSNRAETTGNLPMLTLILNHMAETDSYAVASMVDECLRDSTSRFEPQIAAQACVDVLIKAGDEVLARELIEQWAQDLAPSHFGAAAFESIALHTAQSSPSTAAEWLKSLPASDARNFALGTLASDWVSRDPQAALSWVLTLRSDEGRDEAIQRAYSEWVERDPAKAAAWLDRERVQSGIQTDQMVASLIAASPMARTDGEGALLWTTLIGEPELRTQVFDGVVLRWLHSDYSAAVSYLNQRAELTSEHRERILKAFQKQRADNYAGE